MLQDAQILAGWIPQQDREVRLLLDSARFEEAAELFDQVTATAPNAVEGAWNRATVLVHRALNAWRLGRIPTALELAAEGWSELDIDRPSGTAAAQAISMVGSLLDTIGHRSSALELMSRAVAVAREADDPGTLAHCLLRHAHALLFWAVARPEETDVHEQFSAAVKLYEEGLSLADSGLIRRGLLSGGARSLAGLGVTARAENRATEALQLSYEAEDWSSAALAMWVLSGIRHQQGELEEARTFGSRALDCAEKIRDRLLMTRLGLDLATICEQLGDPVGEAAALRRSLAASRSAVRLLQEGLGQALEQRRIAVQAQRSATAARAAAFRDSLTGLTNRFGLERQAPALLEQTLAQGRVPWLLLIDVDWFKDVNDDAGHTAGDIVLQEISQLLRQACRTDDLVCRWAGDEFVVLLVDTSEESQEAGPIVAERIRSTVDDHDWQLVLGHTPQPPTTSIGAAAGPTSLDHLFAAADIALYRAKQAGRNRVEVDRQPLDPGRQATT
ncbi:diguanylate cyclase (GGDEF)-like protein [Halopolyspora algeriensis]|uniref:Diguanylate cyclase (GGDEF)-like protein n=1 Tax=Halopolyspora algeriensis TaxID=1500506 RepID=A0A368VQ70_9ACTN|nr:diguanylate cyclase [Halopolyspora algeriensis]RCW43690.1 diguanylate cyclase (GGDEF)-like protein [Halopolyspora algeriensis]TQM47528.1 diguanylate cyclase (GGDEF)-like protein [Halopolyspora algeriensis]